MSRPGSHSAARSGQATVLASVSARNGLTMSGLMTSWRIAPMIDESIAGSMPVPISAFLTH